MKTISPEGLLSEPVSVVDADLIANLNAKRQPYIEKQRLLSAEIRAVLQRVLAARLPDWLGSSYVEREPAQVRMCHPTLTGGREEQHSAYYIMRIEIDEKTLRFVVNVMGGLYYREASGRSLSAAFSEMAKIGQTDPRVFASWPELRQYLNPSENADDAQ